MLELVATLSALSAEYLKTREERHERVDADAFRQWLQDDAFPRLLEQSGQALESIIGLKAAEKERFDTLLEHLLAIREMVAGTTAAEQWRALPDGDQTVLAGLFAMFLEDPDRRIDGAALAAHMGSADRKVPPVVRYLEEQGWAHCHRYTGGWAVDLTPAGIRFVWEATDPTGFRTARERLACHLADDEDGERIGVLARNVGLPYQLAQALVQGWADEGLLEFEDDYSPPEAALVHSVSETFRRTIARS